MQAKRVPKESIPPCNLVFLIDKSGSMNANGGFSLLVQALRLLTDPLRPEDSVAIVSYASGVQVELPAGDNGMYDFGDLNDPQLSKAFEVMQQKLAK